MPGITNAQISMSPLALLRQIRDVMGSAASAQSRLDQIVALIAASFVSEVCSVYLLRAGDILELFASQGLKAQSVHSTRLALGQGLVGEIASTASPLNLADAESHPKFVYRPETGEEMYKSFVGVPILQGGKVIGVLVVQSKKATRYSDEQMEVLQTIAMVLSELAISGQLVAAQELKTATGGLAVQQLTGVGLSSGVVRAQAVLHQPQLTITHYVATDLQHEKDKFTRALKALQDSFNQYIQSFASPDEERRQILETYLLFTQDQGWLLRIHDAIQSGLTAEAAVKKVQEELQAKMSQIASPYIKERIHDWEDLSNHLLQELLGKKTSLDASELPQEFILVARALGPAELLNYDHSRIKGLIVEEGSTTSHTAVIARAMDIPAIAKVRQATSIIAQDDIVIIDADAGNVYVRPTEEIELAMQKHIAQQQERAKEYDVLRNLEAISRDGQRISLNINTGLFVDAKNVMQEGVDGIGLYRTELPYMTSGELPEADVQEKLYSQIYAQLPGKRIIFRSFDIGGDKKVPYLHIGEEENPAMGWRATRIGLERPGILRTQFKALIAASAGKRLHVMFPFIAQVSEFDATKRLFDQELALAQERGQTPPLSVELGVMVEIPALMWQLPALMEKVDFVSIGSNDLMQFLFACDRGAPHMAGHYDTLSPVFLNVVRQVVEAGARYGAEVSFCGEMARKPLDALALLGVGVRNLSVSSSAVGPLKAMIRSVDIPAFAGYLSSQLDSTESSLRYSLEAYARDHSVPI